MSGESCYAIVIYVINVLFYDLHIPISCPFAYPYFMPTMLLGREDKLVAWPSLDNNGSSRPTPKFGIDGLRAIKNQT